MLRALLAAALAVGLGLPAAAQPKPQGPPAVAHMAVSTTQAQTQALFDRGLAMLYAFSVGEARLTFARVAESDPNLALAWWGAALADTIDINLPDSPEGDKRGAAAVSEAQHRESGASPSERALIDAIALRYTGKGSTADHQRRYADAMTAYALAHPDDANALTLAAYAQWNTVDDLTTPDGAPTPMGQKMAQELDRALALDPNNIGAHHLRIHVYEELGHAEVALTDAQYLDAHSYELGMSHLPHMAGHVYARIGDFDALVAANRRAVANDDAYFALGDGPGQSYMRFYHDHDLDFIIYGLTTQGRNAEATAAIAHEDQRINLELALRLHDDAHALELATALENDAGQAIALARLGRPAEALTAVKKVDLKTGYRRAQAAIVAALIARGKGDSATAIAQYRNALRELGTDPGDPKTLWFVPPGEALGAVQLAAGQAAAAEATFAAQLARFPNDPRLAFGLAEAQRAQGKDDAAARAIVQREWKGDRPLTAGDLG